MCVCTTEVYSPSVEMLSKLAADSSTVCHCSPQPGKWVYHRDGHDLHTRLRHELKQLTGQDLELNPCLACGKLNTCQVGCRCGRAGADLWGSCW